MFDVITQSGKKKSGRRHRATITQFNRKAHGTGGSGGGQGTVAFNVSSAGMHDPAAAFDDPVVVTDVMNGCLAFDSPGGGA